jgi:hypothetical protein
MYYTFKNIIYLAHNFAIIKSVRTRLHVYIASYTEACFCTLIPKFCFSSKMSIQSEALLMRRSALGQCQLCKNSDAKEKVEFAKTNSEGFLDTLSTFWMAFTGSKDAGEFSKDVEWLCKNCAFEFR